MSQTLLFTLVASMVVSQSAPASMPYNPNTTGRVATPLVPMTEHDVRKLLDGCLDYSPYPADGGPVCFYPDGVAILMGGWRNTKFRYEVVANRVLFTHAKYAPPNSMSFYHDGKRQAYYRGTINSPARLAKFCKR